MAQIKSMPVSLSVAQAEKRVVEAKLEKATSTYAANLKKVNDGTVRFQKYLDELDHALLYIY